MRSRVLYTLHQLNGPICKRRLRVEDKRKCSFLFHTWQEKLLTFGEPEKQKKHKQFTPSMQTHPIMKFSKLTDRRTKHAAVLIYILLAWEK